MRIARLVTILYVVLARNGPRGCDTTACAQVLFVRGTGIIISHLNGHRQRVRGGLKFGQSAPPTGSALRFELRGFARGRDGTYCTCVARTRRHRRAYPLSGCRPQHRNRVRRALVKTRRGVLFEPWFVYF
jgi:hypothetical protein